MGVRPAWSGLALASTKPERTGRRKLVFDSIVVVAAPRGTFKKANQAAAGSSKDIGVPPCRTPNDVQSDGCDAMRKRTSSAPAVKASTRRRAVNDIILTMKASSAASSLTASLLLLGLLGAVLEPLRPFGELLVGEGHGQPVDVALDSA